MKFLPSLKSAKSLALVAVTIATSIAASNMTSTLAQTTPTAVDLVKNAPQKIAQNSTQPSTRPGSIAFTGNANLFTGFQVKYTLGGKSETFQREPSLTPQTVVFDIPPQATNVVAIPQYQRGIGSTKQIINISEQPVNPNSKVCLTIEYMAPFAPTVSNKCTVASTPPPAPPAPAPLPPLRLPSLVALPPSRIISYPGNPEHLAVFNESSESFPMGCPAVRRLWSGIETQQVTREEYYKMQTYQPTKFGHTKLAGALYCNSPDQIQGYISPAFGKKVPGTPTYAGAVVVNGKTFMLNSPEFFGAMGIKPIVLDDKQVRDFLNNSTFGETVLTIKR